MCASLVSSRSSMMIFGAEFEGTKTLVLVINLVVSKLCTRNSSVKVNTVFVVRDRENFFDIFSAAINVSLTNRARDPSVKITVLGLFCTDLAAPRPTRIQDLS